jgi:CubicO group peptidase (beta-lactamase class C family)
MDSAIDSTAIIYKLLDGEKKAFALDTHFASLAKADLFNGSVLIAQRGVVIYNKAFGWADYTNKDSLRLSSPIQLASVSKQFTAAAILLLKQEGKLNYDDPVQKYFPDTFFHGITIRQLLTHRSGLPIYTYFCDDYYRKKKEMPEHFNNDSVLMLMRKIKPSPDHKPNEKYDYCNTGYVFLASIVEKISGMSFAQFMHDRFFVPLKMYNTWVNTDSSRSTEKTKAYYGKWKYWDENYLDGVSGDKGVFSTTTDLFIWDRALRNETILKQSTLKDAFIGYSPELEGKESWNYGFGWRIRTFSDGAKAVFHNGWWHGSTTTFYRGLSDDVTIIILCNKYNRGIYYVDPILDLLGAHHLPLITPAESDQIDSIR